jgi:NodT family efflux transporter outer membrane factor (OMF) lipoprotein
MRRAAPFLLLATLSACAQVSAGPEAASVKVPQQFIYAPPTEERGTLAALLPSGDPAFTALIARVDAEAPDLALALTRIQIARAGVKIANAERLPRVDASAGASASQSSPNAAFNVPNNVPFDRSRTDYSLGLEAGWEIDLFGRLKATARAAGLRLNAADADAKAVRLAVVTDIARAVTDYRGAEARRAIIAADLKDASDLVSLTRVRARAGIVPGFDLVRAQSLEADAKSRLPVIETEQAAALGRLVTLTASDGPTLRSLLQGQSPKVAFASVEAGLPSILLRQRPDIVAAEFRLGAANADIAVAAAARFPRINISSALGLATMGLGSLFSGDSLTASLGGNIAAPLIDFGRTQAQINAREAQAQEAFADYRRLVFVAIGECETALGTLSATRARHVALEAQLRIESDALGLARERYRLGLSDLLTVIDAQRQLNTVRQAATQAQTEAERAAIAVYRSFGGA